jgi:transposase InsO family protein
MYFVTFIDDRSRYTKIYLLKNKAEIFSKFKQYKIKLENQTRKMITMLRSDNGREYKPNEFNLFCQNHGIQCQFTTPHTLQQNGICERKN